MAITSAASLTGLVRMVLQSVEEHLNSQRLVASTDSAGLNLPSASLRPTTLVISSSDFLSVGEEGAVEDHSTTSEQSDMSCDEEEPVSQGAHNDPYGVIEVSSLFPREQPAELSDAAQYKELGDRLEIAGLSVGHMS